MFTWLRKYQEKKARHIVVVHACRIRDEAARIERNDRARKRSIHSIPVYIERASLRLDTRRLERLLHTDTSGVAHWANRQVAVQAVLGCHGVQFVQDVGEFALKETHRLKVAPSVINKRVVTSPTL